MIDPDPLGYIDEEGDAFRIVLPGKMSASYREGSPIAGLRWWARQDIEWRINAIAENRAWLVPHFSWAYGHCRDAERQWMAGLASQRASGAHHYAIIAEGAPVGSLSIYVDPPTPYRDGIVTPSAEITYWVTKDNTGKGYGSAALEVATRYAHEAGVDVCYLLIDAMNVASIKTSIKAGYAVDRPPARPDEQVLMCHAMPGTARLSRERF